MTTPDRFSPEFMRSHLGASQVPTAIGVSPYARPVELWEEFLGLRERTEAGEAAELGHELEDGVARVACKRLGAKAAPGETLVHANGWLVATPDRLLSDGTLLEVKTSGLASYQGREVSERWGEPGTDEVPVHVAAQVITQMGVARDRGLHVDAVHVAALLAGRGVQLYRVAWDAALWASVLRETETFWSLVKTSSPPTADGSDAFSEMLTRRFPTSTDTWAEGVVVDHLAQELRKARGILTDAEQDYETVRQRCMEIIGNHAGMRGAWGKQAWTPRAGRKTLDVEALSDYLVEVFMQPSSAMTPDMARTLVSSILATCQKQGKPFRAFEPMRLAK